MPARMIPYSLPFRDHTWQRQRGQSLVEEMNARRSCRYFSDRPVDREIIELALTIAHSAPSGANRKPWRFVAIDDPQIKHEIRAAAEAEERAAYDHKMPPEWLAALEPLGTTPDKPFLELAPWLVVVFRVDWELIDGHRRQNYYPKISATLACGFLLAACHQLGLATLTYTPPNVALLRRICRRPENEKPVLLIPVGYPADDCQVPDLVKKPLSEVLQWNR